MPHPRTITDISARLAQRVLSYQRFTSRSESEITWLIEQELDRYVNEGTITIVEEANRR